MWVKIQDYKVSENCGSDCVQPRVFLKEEIVECQRFRITKSDDGMIRLTFDDDGSIGLETGGMMIVPDKNTETHVYIMNENGKTIEHYVY